MTFSTMKGGAFERLFQRSFQELLDDAADPDKLITAKRTMTMRFEYTPTSRAGGRLVMKDPTLKLAPNEVPTVMQMRVDFERGVATAYERNGEEDGHRTLFDHNGDVSEDVETTQ